ncbi:MAG TPA: response regulator [Fibrobacteraceae bacterium]|nr:response regulator [Fibrobacteraceae bacterium]
MNPNRILIVDDNFVTRKMLARLLEPYGICDVAENGQVAQEAFQLALYDRQPYRLVCLDVRMPGLDGTEVLEKLRAMEQKHGISLGVNSCRILMVTGVDDRKTVFESFRKNCDGYLIKPVGREQLVEQLKTLGLLE